MFQRADESGVKKQTASFTELSHGCVALIKKLSMILGDCYRRSFALIRMAVYIIGLV